MDYHREAHLAIEDVLITESLATRRSRPPAFAAEAQALSAIIDCMAGPPHMVLQALVNKVVDLTGADSAGISIAEVDNGEQIFRWHAIGGEFASFVGGTMQRYNSPCGLVLDTNAVQLMRVPEKHFQYAQQPPKPIEEALLVPFHDGDTPIGTVWAIMHRIDRHFDNEDERLITSLARLAAAAVRNLNQIRQLEEGKLLALQDAKRKTEFLAILAHDLRNPLGPIVNAVNFLKRSPMESSANLMLDVIGRQSNQLRKIVDDLLDVSRASFDKMELRKTKNDLLNTVRSAIETSKELIQSKEQTFTENLPDHEIILDADHARLTQAIANLLNNASRYTPVNGEITLKMAKVGAEIMISVRDSGVGIEPESQERIFELFAQGSQPQNRGLGIGLALAKRIVELHGGHLRAASEGEGRGSEFTIVLPAQPRY
jgi:signal transduction histidine kinase